MAESKIHHESAECQTTNTVLSRIVDGVRWGAYQTAKGGVQVSADVLGFGLEATGYVAGKTIRTIGTGSKEIVRGIVNTPFKGGSKA